ncbi:thermonuclease family protein [Candidatus Omnitrophota bacterium]
MSKKLTPATHYKTLISTIQSTLNSGLNAAKLALEYARLKTYWEVGRRIRAVVDSSDGELVMGEKLYQRISLDLGGAGLQMSADLVFRSVQFHRNYPVFPHDSPLTFTHYIALQRVKDPDARGRLEERAVKKGMSALDVKAAVLKLTHDVNQQVKKTSKLRCVRGEPFVYAAIISTGLTGGREACIDCGFKINVDMPQDNAYRPKQSRLVRSFKEEPGYKISRVKDCGVERFTYCAQVLRVVDGDTLDVRIDVGFGIHLNDRLRLAGINTEEMKTQAGKTAKRFVSKQLKNCPNIIIRTKKAGMYGRWLADVFFHSNCKDPFKIAAEGQYLNQLLLDEGMAKVY